MIRAIRASVLPIFLLFVSAFCFVRATSPAPTGRLIAANACVDLGRLAQGSVGRADYQLKNDSDRRIQIEETIVDCSCTVASPAATVLEPGQTTRLQLALDTENQLGRFHTSVHVLYKIASSKNSESLLLDVSADISPSDSGIVSIEPVLGASSLPAKCLPPNEFLTDLTLPHRAVSLPSLFWLTETAFIQQDEQEIPEPKELRARALQARRNLITGHVVFEASFKRYEAATDYEQIKRTYDVTFEGDNIRSVVDWRHPNWSKTTRVLLGEPLSALAWSDQFRVNLGQRATIASQAQDAIDPRVLGLNPSQSFILSRHPIDDLIDFSNSETSIHLDEHDGQKAWRLDYKKDAKAQWSVWFIPDYGDNIGRVSLTYTVPETGEIYQSNVSSSFRKYGDVWFPNRVILSDTMNGKVIMEERIQILTAVFNTAVDPTLFTVEKLGLPPGTKLLSPDGFALIWDGVAIVPETGGTAEVIVP